MGLVDDDEFGAVLEKGVLVPVRLDEIDADHLNGIEPIDALMSAFSALQLIDGSRTNDNGFEVDFLFELDSPLIAEIGRAEDR